MLFSQCCIEYLVATSAVDAATAYQTTTIDIRNFDWLLLLLPLVMMIDFFCVTINAFVIHVKSYARCREWHNSIAAIFFQLMNHAQTE